MFKVNKRVAGDFVYVVFHVVVIHHVITTWKKTEKPHKTKQKKQNTWHYERPIFEKPGSFLFML